MFPIAWAVVESETKDAWMWFLDQLSAYLNLCDGRGYTMISDQQKGLENAIKEVLPNIEHRMCARHVYANFRALFTGGTLKNLFWQAAKCGTEREFDDIMIKIREISPEAEEYLTVKKTPSQWCRAWYGTHSGCDSVENNMCETFNGVIVEARTLKIIDMLEDIRRYITRRMQIKAKEIDRWEGTVCPRIVKKMEKTEENCGHWKAEFCGNNLWEVKSTRHGYKVDLNNSMCSCRQWDISGVPCVHALAAILECKGEKEEYVAGWFKVDKIKKAYSKFLGPLNGENLWAKTGYLPIIPPKDRRMPGRPKIARRKQRHESPSKGQGAKVTKNQCAQPKRVSRVGGKNQCSLCKEYGHNKAKCPQKGQIVINVNTLEQSQSQSININAPQNSSTNDPQCSNIGQSSITEPPSHDNFLLSTLLPTKAATPRGTSTKTAAPKGTSTKTAAPRRTSTKAATPRGTSTKTAAPKGTSTKTAAPRGTSTKTAAQRGTFIKFAAPRGTSTKNAAPRMISTNNSGHAMPSTMTAALRLSSTNNSGHAFEATMTAAPIMSSTKNSGHSMPSTMTAAPRMSSTNNSSQQMPSTMTAGQPRPPLAMILNKTFKPPISKITSRSPISKSISELDPMLQKREPLPQKSFNPPFNFGMYQCPNGGMYSRAPGAKRGRWTPGPKNQPTTKSHQVQPPPSTSQASNTVVKRCLDTSTKKWKSLNDL